MTSCTSGDGRDGDDREVDPLDLWGVGSATAAVIEEAPFSAADIAAKNVSYTMLVDAGINPGVAERLRRKYSLVWSFRWTAGANLEQRARRLAGLSQAERDWIIASLSTNGSSWNPADPESDDDNHHLERAWREWIRDSHRLDPSTNGDAADTRADDTCDRCGDELGVYSLRDRHTVLCDSCGYVGVARDHRSTGRSSDESWEDALYRFFAEE